MPPNVSDFLKEFTALCEKYNVSLDGCGCCGSPGLEFPNATLNNVTYITASNISYKSNKGLTHDPVVVLKDSDKPTGA